WFVDVEVARRGDPAVGAAGDPLEVLFGARGTHQHRDVRLHRLGPGPAWPELDELTVIGGLFLGPQRTHRLEVLTQHGAPARGRDVVVGELVGVPTESDAQADPPAG